ncbi:hypothetical protein BCV71DRAFT_239822 [Rhizopus microsporus]|uniref:Uncharacterized protein n=1 Tax=Rhizopus microsporus TaxID=58291 RepID=A0A1X0RLE9_RHIZD|nr:hypothetical protein BCV71DRAFT_239822 [Rhizopus microsporus]
MSLPDKSQTSKGSTTFKKQRKSISPAVPFEAEAKPSTKEHEIVTQSDDEHLEVTVPKEHGCEDNTSLNPNYMEISEHRKQLDQGEESLELVKDHSVNPLSTSTQALKIGTLQQEFIDIATYKAGACWHEQREKSAKCFKDIHKHCTTQQSINGFSENGSERLELD